MGGFAVDVRVAQRVTYVDGLQTLSRLIVPQFPVPSCGWPLVVYVHMLGATHTLDEAWQKELASHGFAVWAYDVRGQGAAEILNPKDGTTLYGALERYDLAEQIGFARTLHPGLVSASRVAVIGDSQGGIHAWFAAGQSGRPLSVKGRGTITFPVIDAVVPADYVAEPLDHRVRGGTLFSRYFVDLMLSWQAGQFHLDSVLQNLVLTHFEAQDPVALVRDLSFDPARLTAKDLKVTSVPILHFHAWHDAISGPKSTLDLLSTIPQTTPFRAVLSPHGPHQSVDNTFERNFRHALSLRWLDHFLWDVQNNVESEARYVDAELPLDDVVRKDPKALFGHAFHDLRLAKDIRNERYFLTDSGFLVPQEPATGVPTTIVHKVAAGYTPKAYVSSQAERALATVLSNIPLSEQRFRLPPLSQDAEISGSAALSLSLRSDASAYTVAAALFARLPGAASEQMLSSWGVGILSATPGQVDRVAFELSPILTQLPAGTELSLSVRNHWLDAAPHHPELATLPMFSDSTLSLGHGAGVDASWLELPFRVPRIKLVSQDSVLDFQQTSPIDFELRGGTHEQGRPYIVAMSLSGQQPGIVMPGGILPVRMDPATIVFVQAIGGSEFTNFFGLLDAKGEASLRLDFSAFQPLPAGLYGQKLSLAAWVYRSAVDLSGRSSNPVDLEIR